MSINSRNAASIDELCRTNGSDVAPRAALEQFSHQLAQAYEEVHLLFRFARLFSSAAVFFARALSGAGTGARMPFSDAGR